MYESAMVTLLSAEKPFSQPWALTRRAVKPLPATPVPCVFTQSTSVSWMSRPVEADRTHQLVHLIREFLMVTLAAWMVRQPLMSAPSMVVPAVLIVRGPVYG